ncbi:MAG: hypothetical protein QGG65_09895 [Gammaproteobacteria bacterium]|nr:hypothetical protein [Gammaproteobacteria bacterium]HJP03968.1 hypothetical protein [Gammaproteobacteria bacterium]
MIDERSRSATSLFMLLAIVVMAALAYSVSQRSRESYSNETVQAGAIRDWVDRSITELPAKRISKLTASYPDGKTMTVNRIGADANSLTLGDMTEYGTLGANGSLITVAEIPVAKELIGFKPVTIVFETPDGLIIETRVFSSANRTLLQVTAAATETTAGSEAQAIKARTSGLLYHVAGY